MTDMKTLARDVAEIDHRYKKSICLLKTDLPMQVTSVCHKLINFAFKAQADTIIPKIMSQIEANNQSIKRLNRQNVAKDRDFEKKKQDDDIQSAHNDLMDQIN